MKPQYVPASGVVGQAVEDEVVEVGVVVTWATGEARTMPAMVAKEKMMVEARIVMVVREELGYGDDVY